MFPRCKAVLKFKIGVLCNIQGFVNDKYTSSVLFTTRQITLMHCRGLEESHLNSNIAYHNVLAVIEFTFNPFSSTEMGERTTVLDGVRCRLLY